MSANSRRIFSETYIGEIEDLLLERYQSVVERNDPAAATLLRQKGEIEGSASVSAEPRQDKKRRMDRYVEFWNGLTPAEQLSLSSHDAKMNHLARLMQIMGTTEIVQAHNKVKATTAESFDFVLERFRAEAVTARELQSFIDENAVAWLSLTGHPTNPTTVPYTKAQIDLARVIANPDSTPSDLETALQIIYETSVVGVHKTPLQEAEETLATLSVLYETALPLKRFFEKSLSRYGYADEGVVINRPLIVPCSWTLGDGDGNPNLTREALVDGIALHRRTVAAHYLATMEAFIGEYPQALRDEVDGVKRDLMILAEGRVSQDMNAEALIERLHHIAKNAPESAAAELRDLAYLVTCFGLGFGTIDIRHNAVEILETALRLAAMNGIGEFEELQKLSLDHAAEKLESWLENQEVLNRMQATSIDAVAATGDEAAARIFGRLRAIGEQPDMSEKLIIAETTHPAHALAALLLLKVTGNIVAEEGSRIDLTILSESVKDLLDIGSMLETLLNVDIFRRHVVSRKRLLVMIAKSDTTRQDGRGEAEYAQYEAAVEIYHVADRMKRKYPELEAVKTSIENGGGHALQRGGGRVTEIAALHGRAASDARVTDCGPSTLTVQGEQLTILFCPGKVALGSLEAFVSQNLYTKAGVRGEMRIPHFAKNINKQYAQADAWLYAKSAGIAFDKYTRGSSAIDRLLVAAPWLAMKAGNASSRPAKRGERTVEPGITPSEAKGRDPRALQGRAISGERLTGHACLPIFSILGLVEAMQAVRNHGEARANLAKYGDALHHLYLSQKIHRDGARATINAVVMADFDIAWPLLAGEARPDHKAIARLAAAFDPAKDNSTPQQTLAFLEEYFLAAERLSFEMVYGAPARRKFHLGDALRTLWPELAEQVASRDRRAEFSRVIECYRTRQFDLHPDTPLDETQFRITQALYTAANVVSTPVGILATRTRLEPVRNMKSKRGSQAMLPGSFSEADVRDTLAVPAALR